MAKFPSKENDVLVLAAAMITGLGDNPGVFPNLPVSVGNLSTFLAGVTTKMAQIQANEAALAASHQEKKINYEVLVAAMKQLLTYAESVTAGDNAKLELIGWGARKPEAPVPPPGQPEHLECKLQGEGNITLNWGRPLTGGAVLFYKIQRRERPAGAWGLIETSHLTTMDLVNQARGKEYEYRIIANNKAGDSLPSNVVMVVL